MTEDQVNFPLEMSDLPNLGFNSAQVSKREQTILRHIDEGRYPSTQFALARHDKLAAFRSYGNARIEPETISIGPDTLFLLFSNTKVLVSSAVWLLVEDGIISLSDPVAEYMPAFAANGKEGITIQHVMTHQGGLSTVLVRTYRRCQALRWQARRNAPASAKFGTDQNNRSYKFNGIAGGLILQVEVPGAVLRAGAAPAQL